MTDKELLRSWADTGVTPYPKDQQTTAAARKLLHSEIARWGEVVRDNKIEAPIQ